MAVLVVVIIMFSLFFSMGFDSPFPLLLGIAVSLVVVALEVRKLQKISEQSQFDMLGLDAMQRRVDYLEALILAKLAGVTYAGEADQPEPAAPAEEIKVEEVVPEAEPAVEMKTVSEEKPLVVPQPEPQPEPEPERQPEPVVTSPSSQEEFDDKMSQLWEKVQQTFIENWTGILGSVILVVGMGFMGVYTALKVVPVYRFIMLLSVSALLMGIFTFLKGKAKWLKLALWLRSSAGAIFLFACLGAGGLKGLQWIENPLYGLMVLCAGVAVNLYLGWIGGKEVFGSLHVLLSLAALAVAPANTLILIVAAVVTLFGIGLTYRERWEYHLLLSISLFFAYHLYWYSRIGAGEITRSQNIVGIITVVLVSVLAILVHYRALYKTAEFDRLPFFVHFINWVYFGIGLYFHSMGSVFKPAVIACGAAGAFWLARRARKIGIQWLYITDTLMGQVIALVAFFSLYQLEVEPLFIVAMMLAETLVYLVVMLKAGERLLSAVGTFIMYVLGLGMAVLVFQPGFLSETSAIHRCLLTLGAGVVMVTFFCFYLLRNVGDRYHDITADSKDWWLPVTLYFSQVFYGVAMLYLYNSQWYWSPPAIALLGGAAYWAAKKAKDQGLQRFFFSAALLAQFFMILAFVSLSRWKLENTYVFAFIVVETLVFLLLMIKEEEKWLQRIGTGALLLFSVVFMMEMLTKLDFKDTGLLYRHAILLTVVAAAVALFHLFTQKRFPGGFDTVKLYLNKEKGDSIDISLTGPLAGLLLLAAGAHIYRMTVLVYVLAALVVLLIYTAYRSRSGGLGLGIAVLMAGLFLQGWNQLDLMQQADAGLLARLLYALPLFALPAALIRMPFNDRLKPYIKAFGVYFFYINLMVTTLHLCHQRSVFLPGMLWLAASVVTLELAARLRRKYGDDMSRRGDTDRFLLHMGYLLIIGFLLRHIGLHIPSHQQLAGISLRFLSALSGLAIFAYWALRRLPEREGSGKSYDYLHPLFLELVVLFSILTIAVEIAPRWFPVVWMAVALLLLIRGASFTGKTSRIRWYSLLFYWASTIYVALVPTLRAGTGLQWYETTEFTCTAAIFLQFLFIVLLHRLPFLEGLQFPKALAFMSTWTRVLNQRKNLWIHYPLFISVAVFLFQTFDRSILTLLWVVECFLIFVLAVVLKENHFRYLAMSGLALSLIRLVFYDLAKSNTITRALVFIGVGILMLVMNSLYNKYKERF